MPNAYIEKKELKKFPFKLNDFEFCYKVDSKFNSLVLVKGREERFFLQLLERDDKYLLKADKITRPANVKIVQDAMICFIEANDMKIVSSNIFSKKNNLKKKSIYLKEIEYFLDFNTDKEVEIEIGFGSGRHLLYQAKNNPYKIFIGLEIHKPSVEQLLKQCKLQNIENILVVNYDARILLQVLRSNIAKKIYVHFPIPWDKKPHRRVISRSFLKEALRVLKKDGRVEIRTDSENYFYYCVDEALSFSSCKIWIKKNIELDVSSKYEDRWKRENKNIYDIHIVSNENSPQKSIILPKVFDKEVCFKPILKKFCNSIIKKDGYFVHFENIYKKDENSGVIKLSFGAYDKCEKRYIVIEDKRASYLPKTILPVYENVKAQKIIREYLYGK